MPKRYTRKRRKPMKKRFKKTKGKSIARTMQAKSLSFVKKKYTVVIPIRCNVNETSVVATISHIGGKNAATPADTITLDNVNPNQMLTDQMKLYQFFKISGVAFKLFFPEGTDP